MFITAQYLYAVCTHESLSEMSHQQGEVLSEQYITACNNHVWGGSRADQYNSMFSGIPMPFMYVIVSSNIERKTVQVHGTEGRMNDRDAVVTTLVVHTPAADSHNNISKVMHVVSWKPAVGDLLQVG